ncbi:hypothetical protein NA56DRAFT_168338 [Hyaloscypha hepaticicola]|uniref:Uncharacterized protein n=1 Tax=Hyaloscypha hepaticicola TaxID=2082293 RepID=A0A2J6Q2P2_9HELO|nr:hypothetical protein NA56DRAFT_168338 [Hyaloscypha hepaticicola]
MHGCSELFSLGLPYICLGEQTCRVRESNGAWGGRPFCRAGGQGRFKGGQGKADSSSLGGAWCKVAGRPQRSRQTDRRGRGRTGTAIIAHGGAAPGQAARKKHLRFSQKFRIRAEPNRASKAASILGGLRASRARCTCGLSHSPGGWGNDQQKRWRGEGRGVMAQCPSAQHSRAWRIGYRCSLEVCCLRVWPVNNDTSLSTTEA